MSQPHKRKSKESRKGGTKTDSSKSKQGVGMSTGTSEEKSKSSEPGKVEGAKPISSMSKSSVKPGSAATQKSTDSSKHKTTSGSSVLPGAAGGVKQQQPQTTATCQTKMGQMLSKTSTLDTKENQDRTHPAKLTGTSLHKNNDSKIQDGKPMLSAMEQLMDPFPSQGPDAPIPKHTGPAAKDEDPFDLLAGTLPSEAPVNSTPKYTGPKVTESGVTNEKGERLGEHESTIPPDYRFKEQPDPQNKDKPASSSTGPGAKPKTTKKTMSDADVLDSLSADLVQSPPATISKCSAAVSHSAVLPLLKQQAPEKYSPSKAPLQASKAATVSTSLPGPQGKDPFDLLAETLPSEAPDDSAPKYTGPEVKEPSSTEKLFERVGERESTIPPDYRFKEQPDPKGKGQLASSVGPAAKPKTMSDADVLESLSADLVQCPPATISKCSAAVSHTAVLPPLKQQAPAKDSPSKAPLQASKAATVSASLPGPKGKDPFDLLAETLPSEAPDDSTPKYTGPEVKEPSSTEKLFERVGERESTIPPDYRFKEQPDPKQGKGQLASSVGPAAKPKTMSDADVLESLSADLVQCPPATISKCSAAVSHTAVLPPLKQQAPAKDSPSKAPLQASKAATVSASLPGPKGKDPFDLLAETLPSEAPDDSTPKYTGPEVKEPSSTEKLFERVGERESTIPPDYRFKEQPDPKQGKGQPASSVGPAAKPKTMSDADVLDSLSADLVQCPPATISKCSAAVSHTAVLPPLKQQAPAKDSPSKAPLQASKAATVSASLPGPKGKDPFDLLAETLPSEAPDDSTPKYTGPEVKESDATKKKGERVGEWEHTIPPDYRYKEQPGPRDKLATSTTGIGAKPKTMTEGDVLDSLSADFIQSCPAPISKCSAATSHAAAPPSFQKEVMTDDDILDSLSGDFVQSSVAPISKCSVTPPQFAPLTKPKEAPLKASAAASVSASQTHAKDKDPFDLLGETLPSEAPDNSAPKFSGPEVKESASSKKKAERVGETEESIPPEYRFTQQADPKDKDNSKMPPFSTGAGTKPKAMTEGDVLKALSADFVQSSAAPVSKCSAPVSHTALPPTVKQQAMTEGDVLKALSADFVQSSAAPVSKCSAPVSHTALPPTVKQQATLQASTAASVSSSQSSTKDKDVFDLLANTLPSEAPDTSGPKYTGPLVKETDANKKKAERVGEIEESIPPDYRFTNKQNDPKDKGKPASAAPGAKPKLMTKEELVDSLSSDFDSSSSASHSVAPVSKQKEEKEKPAAKPDAKKVCKR
ncbi:calpastatin isoform X2 [Rhinoraja longicauda]